jgi:hypothetical protein
MFVILTKQPAYRCVPTDRASSISLESTSLGCSVFLPDGYSPLSKWQKSDFSAGRVWQPRHGVARPTSSGTW